MSASLLAVSLWEPWASAMALEKKQIETRRWSTNYRGDLVICASKRKMNEEDLETFQILVQPSPDYQPKYGMALCVVELFACVPTDLLDDFTTSTPQEFHLGNYEPGRFAWMTRSCRRLRKPVPVTGRQGFWYLPRDVADQVRAQL